jgi:hypothetical protein
MPLAAIAAVAKPAEPALSPARADLRRAIMDRDATQRSAAEARRPYDRLIAIIASHDRAIRELEHAKAEDEAELGRWLASGEGDRPGPSEATLEAQRKVDELSGDAAAARGAVNGFIPQLRETQDRLAAASARHVETIGLAAICACAETITSELIPAIEQVLRVEAKIRSAAAALRERSLSASSVWNLGRRPFSHDP